MEHELLRNKLESMDLSKVNGLQWDQERTWFRLNAQLEVATTKKTPIWKYGIAASIFFLIALGTGYLMTYPPDTGIELIVVNQSEVKLPAIVESEETTLSDKSLTETKQMKEQPDILLKKEEEQPPMVNKDTKVESVAITSVTTEDEAIQEKKSIEIVDKKLMTVAEVTASEESLEHLIEAVETTKEITTIPEVVETKLSSQPIAKNNKKFSIRLFRKKNKQSANNVDKVPPLTLFARN